MKFCHLHFDAKYCFWQIPLDWDIQKQIEFCRNAKCLHGSITEKNLSSGEIVAFISCDYSWNPFDWKATTQEQRELIIQ